ncbi:MAG: hypothetical protein RL149_970 [Actinomycetota bacterium]|jgi:hypothetical protein
MIKISRLWLTVITVTFGIFLNVMGLLRFEHFSDRALVLSTNLLHLVCLLLTAVAFRSTKLPTWAALINLAAVIYIPAVLHGQHIGELIGDYDTWYVTALAVLLGAMAVREQIALAVIGAIILFIEVVSYGGWGFAPHSGITGAVMLVATCIAISIGLDRSANAIAEFQRQTSYERQETLLAETARAEHQTRIDDAIARVMPTLEEISKGKKFSKSQREAASRLAQELDDEISGGRLAVASVKRAIEAARDRGVEVTLIDEAELETDQDLTDLIDIAVEAIDHVSVGRIKLQATKNEPYLLRLTATRPGVVTPDLDLKLGER